MSTIVMGAHSATTEISARASVNIKVVVGRARFEEGEGPDLPITVYGIEIVQFDNQDQGKSLGSWQEVFGSEIETEAFLRGLQAGASMIGGLHFFNLPEVPRPR